MTYLIIAVIFSAAAALVTYGVMKSGQVKVEKAIMPLFTERDKVSKRNQELEAQAIERRINDAYINGCNSRNREVADLHREITILREQVKLEAALDERAGGPGQHTLSGSKVVNIHGGRG